MNEQIVTASALISFAMKLEDNSIKFYEQLSKKFTKEPFLLFTKESKNNKILLNRTYQETISDALEACFIRGLKLPEELVELKLKEGISYPDALKMAIELEEKAGEFYLNVAKRSESLLATISVAFKKVGERRGERKSKLKLLLEKLKRSGVT